MTLEQLRIFVAVAEREHVTRAAAELNLTQSATSAAIAALEHRHAVKLFDRVGRRIVLTDAGRLLLTEARAILARAATGERVLSDLAGLKRGRLSLAASQTVGNYWLPRKLALFRARHPGIETPLVIGNTETVAAAIHDGLADIGFVEGEIDDPLLAQEAVATDELAIVVAPGHPWAGRARIDPAEFIESPWVLRELGSGTRQALEAVLAGAGRSVADLDVLLELPANEAVRTAVDAGSAAALMSRLVVANALGSGLLAEVTAEIPSRHFVMLRHKERYVGRPEQAFRALLAGEAA
ncbi:LysR family transcriptional regulator [Bosea sp. (in: a-proteobacteria)]|jgi:DNA-binding transcriptional LysR family regulator|uniref:LysR family transcriptional regulator n=1 Tax=Bosea sp. (in: a-proteobacteria) TaxID=1871050 RepID=UPI002DDD833E|nr:LysR substrate-binding domain-containing protein [Bosea sp. (in: a-proteobacteria)]HEV2511561.1 LysR substrate-binding domain-containing protein [Bosea sp. (in: a-proteobacteria)]